MTPELFQKYLDGLCTKEEKDQVEHWLHTSTPEQLDRVLLPRFDNEVEIPVHISQALWKQIAPARKIRYWPVAASILLLITIGWWMMKPSATQTPNFVRVISPDTVITTQGTIHLPDGSTVELYAQSSLKYAKSFAKRNLYLHGKALFKVAKDKRRPFTVYSGDISTTALGTVFLVNSMTDSITVKLIEGKILVQHQKQSILLPGQQLTYNIHNQTAILHKPSKPKPPVTTKKPSTTKDLAFDNAPLSEVLAKLKIQYSANISYDNKTLDGLYFTGTISVTDELPVVLKAITKMNGLELKQQGNNYSIQPIAQ